MHISLESIMEYENEIISFNFSNAQNIALKADDKIIISS